ncbi:MAG: hypothetical protein Q9215_004462 [Flavoplaca cf. flavocitrina]
MESGGRSLHIVRSSGVMEKSNITTGSALYGRPPITDNDYWIVKAILFHNGLADADPVDGLPFEPFPPVSDETRSGSIIAAVTMSIFVIVSITATRLVARKTIRTSSLGWDDALISAAALAGVTFFSIVGAMVSYGGAGRHLFSNTYKQYYWLIRLGTIGGMVHYLTAGLTKFAIILFNVRLTGSTSKIWKVVHFSCFVVVLAWLLTALFGTVMACKPYGTVMDFVAFGKAVPHVKCNSNNRRLGLALQILHALLDWIVLAIPIIILVRLQMAWPKKLQCIIPLAVGTLSAVGASKRIYDQYHPHPDLSYYLATQLSWTIVDIVCAICVTSLPAINNLLIHHLPRYLSQYWSGGDPGSSPASVGSLLSFRGLFSRNTNNNSSSERKYSNNTGFSGDETKQIMVQRDIDLESVRADSENEPHDPGYLELNELSNGHRTGNTTFINT